MAMNLKQQGIEMTLNRITTTVLAHENNSQKEGRKSTPVNIELSTLSLVSFIHVILVLYFK